MLSSIVTGDDMNNASLLSYPWELPTHHWEGPTHNFKRLELYVTMVIGAGAVALLILWFRKYKLRYLLRGTCVVFSAYVICFPVSLKVLGLMGIVVLSFVILRYHWGMPFVIVKDLLSVGFDHLSEHQRTVHKYDPGDVPPVFPNGWIPIVESSRVNIGQAISVTAIGFRFCVFRGKDGRVRVLDAFCPHLGADLGAGGRVKGDCIECPFHGWQFSGEDGQCTNIPYSEKVLESARVKIWDSCECNEFVFVWHHAEGEAPTWHMPRVSEIEEGKWPIRGRISHVIRCHIQEISENTADFGHVYYLHSHIVSKRSRWNEAWCGILEHVHQKFLEPSWKQDEECQHVSSFNTEQCIFFMGIQLPWSTTLTFKQIGPATIHLDYLTMFGRCKCMLHIVPEGPLLNRVVQVFYTEPRFKQAPANVIAYFQAYMVERDISVWNHMKFCRKPCLVREDKMINKFRRWYGQFYSEHSPTLREIRERSLEW